MLREVLPVLSSDAFVHPLQWEAKAKGKMTKVICNIYIPSLIINIWVDTDELIPPLHMPRVCHEALL